MNYHLIVFKSRYNKITIRNLCLLFTFIHLADDFIQSELWRKTTSDSGNDIRNAIQSFKHCPGNKKVEQGN